MTAPGGNGAVEVTGETNLPDGALINVIASRVSRHKREDENRAIRAGDATATVEGGTFNTVIEDIDESDLAIGIEPGVFGPLAEIDSHLTICAEFRTGDEDNGEPRQPDSEVRDQVGGFGEQLRDSRHAEEFGSATDTPSWWLEVQIAVEHPVGPLDEIVATQGGEPEIRPLRGRFCA